LNTPHYSFTTPQSQRRKTEKARLTKNLIMIISIDVNIFVLLNKKMSNTKN